MFDGLIRFLTGGDPAADEGQDPAFALAVLLIEVARSDDRFDTPERGIIGQALARRFGLGSDEVGRLMRAAEDAAIRATDLHRFTQAVVRDFSPPERVAVIEMLWEVAYSDRELTGDEDALIRRVAGLIYVSDVERGAAKLRVRDRLGRI